MAHPQLIHDESGDTLDLGQPGGTLATAGDAEATYRSRPGPIARDESLFTFAGTNEVFSQYLGSRTRRIDWSGNLALSADGLSALRDAADEWPGMAGTFTFTDDDAREYPGCRIRMFELGQKIRIQQRGDLVWLVPYRIELEQLEP